MQVYINCFITQTAFVKHEFEKHNQMTIEMCNSVFAYR